jgi:NAD(P)-dependent dehydrogenase (short-subunit alcohol dehydrogenase family)
VTRLQNQLALVTGASRGIGAAIAESLVKEGARVIRVARSLQQRTQGSVADYACDLTLPAQVTELAESVTTAYGVPDLVVSNAGGFLLRTLEETTAEDLEGQLAINLRASFLIARAFLPRMRRVGHGCFITIGSIADHRGFPENAAYAASKYGLRGLHETLTEEFRGSGVRLTLVSPGPTDTSMWDPFDPDRREGFIPRAGMLRPRDVAEAVLFVASRPPHVHIDWLRLGPTGTIEPLMNADSADNV